MSNLGFIHMWAILSTDRRFPTEVLALLNFQRSLPCTSLYSQRCDQVASKWQGISICSYPRGRNLRFGGSHDSRSSREAVRSHSRWEGVCHQGAAPLSLDNSGGRRPLGKAPYPHREYPDETWLSQSWRTRRYPCYIAMKEK